MYRSRLLAGRGGKMVSATMMYRELTKATSYLLIALILSLLSVNHAKAEEKWWEKWDSKPNAPRITAKEVKALMMAGEKIIFVYAGYETKEIVCGSLIIPYTLVPPSADGSRVKLRIPKDYWIMCY
jgi:hypothetical protein